MNQKNLMRKGLTLLMFIGWLSAQETPLSEIFFLDLGIVIEPTNGSETYSRIINKPSKEVSFKIKKVESGSVYMASSEVLMSTLGRINERIEGLENSFQTEMNSLRQENVELRQVLIELQTPVQQKIVVKPSKNSETIKKIPVDKSINAKINSVSKPVPVFDQGVYMAGVFAYQREDFQTALNKFSQLPIEIAPKKIEENVLYWMADSYQELGEYEIAISLLNQIAFSGTIRNDDALVQKGLLYKKMGNEPLAQLAFGDIVSQYPDSEYFRLAQMELKKSDKMK